MCSEESSAKVTLDTYADLFDDDLDAVAVTLDSRYSHDSVAKTWPTASSIHFSTSARRYINSSAKLERRGSALSGDESGGC